MPQPYTVPFEEFDRQYKDALENVPYFQGATPEQFAQVMNMGRGETEPLYDVNVTKYRPLKTINEWINKGFEATGLPYVGRQIMEPVGRTLQSGAESLGLPVSGLEEFGGETGAAMPRMLGSAGLGSLLGSFVAPGVGTAVGGALGFGLDAFLQNISETSDPKQAALAGTVAAAIPAGGMAGRVGVTKLLARSTMDPKLAGRFYPWFERLMETAGAQGGMVGTMEVGRQAESIAAGEGLAAVTPQSVAETVVGIAPFVVHDVYNSLRHPPGLAVKGEKVVPGFFNAGGGNLTKITSMTDWERQRMKMREREDSMGTPKSPSEDIEEPVTSGVTPGMELIPRPGLPVVRPDLRGTLMGEGKTETPEGFILREGEQARTPGREVVPSQPWEVVGKGETKEEGTRETTITPEVLPPSLDLATLDPALNLPPSPGGLLLTPSILKAIPQEIRPQVEKKLKGKVGVTKDELRQVFEEVKQEIVVTSKTLEEFNFGPVFHGSPRTDLVELEPSIQQGVNVHDYGNGIYFTQDQHITEPYSAGGRVYTAKLNLKNPLNGRNITPEQVVAFKNTNTAKNNPEILKILEEFEAKRDFNLGNGVALLSNHDKRTSEKLQAVIKEAGYDGIVEIADKVSQRLGIKPGDQQVVVFDKKQVKLVEKPESKEEVQKTQIQQIITDTKPTVEKQPQTVEEVLTQARLGQTLTSTLEKVDIQNPEVLTTFRAIAGDLNDAWMVRQATELYNNGVRDPNVIAERVGNMLNKKVRDLVTEAETLVSTAPEYVEPEPPKPKVGRPGDFDVVMDAGEARYNELKPGSQEKAVLDDHLSREANADLRAEILYAYEKWSTGKKDSPLDGYIGRTIKNKRREPTRETARRKEVSETQLQASGVGEGETRGIDDIHKKRITDELTEDEIVNEVSKAYNISEEEAAREVEEAGGLNSTAVRQLWESARDKNREVESKRREAQLAKPRKLLETVTEADARDLMPSGVYQPGKVFREAQVWFRLSLEEGSGDPNAGGLLYASKVKAALEKELGTTYDESSFKGRGSKQEKFLKFWQTAAKDPEIQKRMGVEKAPKSGTSKPEAYIVESKGAEDVPDADRGLVTMRNWATDYFRARGFEEAKVPHMVEFFTRVSNVFAGVKNVAFGKMASTSGTVAGVYLPQTDVPGTSGLKDYPAIGLMERKSVAREKVFQEVVVNAQVIGHEYAHHLQALNNAGYLGAKQKAVMEQLEVLEKQHSKEELSEILNATFYAFVPADYISDKHLRQFTTFHERSQEEYSEFQAQWLGIVALGVAARPLVPAEVRAQRLEAGFLHPTLNQFRNYMFVDLLETGHAIKAWAKQWELGTNLPDRRLTYQLVQRAIDPLIENTKVLVQDDAKINQAVERLHQLEQFDLGNLGNTIITYVEDPSLEVPTLPKTVSVEGNPEAAPERVNKAVEAAREVFGIRAAERRYKFRGQVPGMLSQFYPMIQFAARYPEGRDVVYAVHDFAHNTRVFLTKLMSSFMVTTRFGQQKVDFNGAIGQVLENPRLNKVVSDIGRDQNAVLFGAPMEESEIRSRVKQAGLGEKEQQAAVDYLNAWGDSVEETHELFRNETKTRLASIVTHKLQARLPEAPSKEIVKLTDEFVNTYYTLAQDMAKIQLEESLKGGTKEEVAQRVLVRATAMDQVTRTKAVREQLNALVGPELTTEVSRNLNEVTRELIGLELMFAGPEGKGTRGYFPEVRTKRYRVVGLGTKEKEMETFFSAYDTPRQAELRAEELQKQGYPVVKVYDSHDRLESYGAFHEKVINAINKIEDKLLERMSQQMESEKFQELVALVDRLRGDVKAEYMSRGIGAHMQKREFVLGREELNLPLEGLKFLQATATAVARRRALYEVEAYLRDPVYSRESGKNEKLSNMLRQYADYILRGAPESKLSRGAREMIFQYTLAGNVSSMLVEGSQFIQSIAPSITRYTGSISGSYKMVGGVVSDIVKSIGNRGRYADEDLNRVLKEAESDGTLQGGTYGQFVPEDDVNIINAGRLSLGKSTLLKPIDILKKTVYSYAGLARSMYANSSRVTSTIAVLSGFKLARDLANEWRAASGNRRVELEQKLKQMRLPTDSGGPKFEDLYEFARVFAHESAFSGGKAGRPWIFAKTGAMSGPFSVAYSLSHYIFSSYAMLARWASEGIGRAQGLSPAERSAARKAFGQALVTQMVMGGAIGLPLSATLLTLIEQLFDVDVMGNMREIMAGLAGEDEELGRFIADASIKGLPQALGINPIDVSGRLGMGSVFGIDPISGAEASDLLGPGASVMKNWISALQAGRRGDMFTAMEKGLPAAYRNVIRLAKNDGVYRDKSGRLKYDPNAAETMLSLIGFAPKKWTQQLEEQRIVDKRKRFYSQEKLAFHASLAKRFIEGDAQGVKAELLKRSKEDERYGSWEDGAKRVIELAQDYKTMDNALTDVGLGESRDAQSVARTYGTRPIVNQQQRLMERVQMLQQLGVMVRPSPRAMNEAALVDSLMERHGLTKAQARAMVRGVGVGMSQVVGGM